MRVLKRARQAIIWSRDCRLSCSGSGAPSTTKRSPAASTSAISAACARAMSSSEIRARHFGRRRGQACGARRRRRRAMQARVARRLRQRQRVGQRRRADQQVGHGQQRDLVDLRQAARAARLARAHEVAVFRAGFLADEVVARQVGQSVGAAGQRQRLSGRHRQWQRHRAWRPAKLATTAAAAGAARSRCLRSATARSRTARAAVR